MSYIRSLSNPEGLYIWEEPKYTYVMQKGDAIRMPNHIFTTIMKRWAAGQADISYRGAKLTEINPPENLPHTKLNKYPNIFRWKLTYKGWGKKQIIMWDVTLFYISSRFIPCLDCEDRKKKNASRKSSRR